MNKTIKLIGILSVAILCSCGPAKTNTDKGTPVDNQTTMQSGAVSSEAAKTEDKIMALHDKTMQGLDSLMALKKELKAKGQSDSIDANVQRLQKSYDDMMDWMSKFQEPDKKMDQTKAETYLNGELQKIQAIDAEINQSKALAKNVLSNGK